MAKGNALTQAERARMYELESKPLNTMSKAELKEWRRLCNRHADNNGKCAD